MRLGSWGARCSSTRLTAMAAANSRPPSCERAAEPTARLARRETGRRSTSCWHCCRADRSRRRPGAPARGRAARDAAGIRRAQGRSAGSINARPMNSLTGSTSASHSSILPVATRSLIGSPTSSVQVTGIDECATDEFADRVYERLPGAATCPSSRTSTVRRSSISSTWTTARWALE